MKSWLSRYSVVELSNLMVPFPGKESKAGGRYLKNNILGIPP